jgi:protein-ribulosamine 3-kinase
MHRSQQYMQLFNLSVPTRTGARTFQSSPSTFFLVTDFLDFEGRSRSQGISKSPESLACKLAKLHTCPSPIPEGYSKPMFGFHVTTCCGDTHQDNGFTETWADFYTNHRLCFIGQRCKQRNGNDSELARLIESTASIVVPRLLRQGHLGGKFLSEYHQLVPKTEPVEEYENFIALYEL